MGRRKKKIKYEGIEGNEKSVKQLTEDAEEFVEESLKGKEEPDDSAEALDLLLKKSVEEGELREKRNKKKRE